MFRQSLRCCMKKYQTISPRRTYALKSPKTISSGNARARNGKPTRQNPEFSDIPSWPIDVLRIACQSGAVKASLPKVYEFLNGTWSLAREGRLSESNTEALLGSKIMQFITRSRLADRQLENGLDSEDLTMIARCLVIQRSDRRLVSLGLDCLSLSADIGDDAAALYLVDLAVENKAEKSIGQTRYQKALSQIKKLAASQELSSMVLLAKIHEQQGDYQRASSLYQEVVKTEANHIQKGTPILEKDRSSYAEAYRNLGRLLSQMSGSEDSAMQCFKRAALEYEDAMSFYYMALVKGESDKDYITFMSQAAISGVTNATYELGLAYAKMGDTEGFTGNGASASYSMAVHWFQLAEESAELAIRAELHIARIRRIQDGPDIKAVDGIANVLDRRNELLSPLLRKFLNTRWEDSVFSLDATTLESKMEEFGERVAK